MKPYTFIILAGLALAIAPLQAAITLSVTGTAQENKFGFVQGQSYTFNYTLSDSRKPGEFDWGTGGYWSEDTLADDPIFANISGTGLTGNYVRPADNYFSPFTVIYGPGPGLNILAWNDDSSSLGLTAPDGKTPIGTISAYTTGVPSKPFPFTPIPYGLNPADYFASFTGTYPLDPGGSLIRVGDPKFPDTGFAAFTATDLVIGTGAEISAVPEVGNTLWTLLLVGSAASLRFRSERLTLRRG